MDQKIKDKWVKALRSGKYKQGNSHLYNVHTDTYCCLGVLAVVCNPKVPMKEIKLHLSGVAMPSLVFQEKHDLDKNKNTIHGSTAEYLADMNDRGDSFEEIADYIEKNL